MRLLIIRLPPCNDMKKQESQNNHLSRDVMLGGNLWNNGLICAFEFVQGHKKTIHSISGLKMESRHEVFHEVPYKQVPIYGPTECLPQKDNEDKFMKSSAKIESVGSEFDTSENYREKTPRGYWIPIGWTRISELVQTVQVDAGWASQPIAFREDDDDITVAGVVAPYWEQPVGPTWWCHVAAGHPFINAWLGNAQWLHPAISIALRDESRLISERMEYLLYEVPVNVAGGLLFELLGQSAGDPFVDEDDIPVVLRSWHAQNFLVTALHIKGFASNINVLGITEVQVSPCFLVKKINDLVPMLVPFNLSPWVYGVLCSGTSLAAGGNNIPRTIHDVIAHLACRLARWDDRLFRKSIFGAADEIELKFMNSTLALEVVSSSEALASVTESSRMVIRVKWSLHAREEIVFELLQHMRGDAARSLLEGMCKSSREMIEEQEAVRGRLFTIQDVMQSTVRAWLQDKSLRVTHNLGVFGGCGLVLSIITGLFGVNLDGIPGADGAPFAFALFSCILVMLGIVLIAIGLLYLGLKKPIAEEQVEVRKLELQELVRMFQHEAESHAQVRKTVPRNNLPPTAADLLSDGGAYFLIN